MKQLKFVNLDNVSDNEADEYTFREAARAVVVDSDGKIALLHVTNEGYYKLPGGGIDKNEDKISALKRECLEEIGCNVEIIEEIGSIEEYQKHFLTKQVSYCYLAKVIGKIKLTNFTDEEKVRGFEPVWMTYAEAVNILKIESPSAFKGKMSIVQRDQTFLAEAGKILNK